MRLKIFVACFIFLCLIALGTSLGAFSSLYLGNHINVGISVGGAHVGGKTVEEARKILEEKVKTSFRQPVVFVVKSGSLRGKVFFVKPETILLKYDTDKSLEAAYEVGRTGNILERLRRNYKISKEGKTLPLSFSLDWNKVREQLLNFASAVNESPANASISLKTRSVVPHRVGTKMNIDKTLDELFKSFEHFERKDISLFIEEMKPEVTTEDLSKINLDTPLAEYSTRLYGTWQRVHNIRLAASSINGTILPPGAIFSYNKIVGPRQAKYGYLDAPVIMMGKLVSGEGGGACQASSTTFNAALLAGVKIIQRTSHTRPSSYCPIGRDATVVYDIVDLKFENNLNGFLVLEGKVYGGKVHIAVYGENPGKRRVELTYAYKNVIPNKEVEQPDPEMEEGKKMVDEKGSIGGSAKLIRKVFEGEKLLFKDHFTSWYRPVDKIIKVGTKPKTPPPGTVPTPLTPEAKTKVPVTDTKGQ